MPNFAPAVFDNTFDAVEAIARGRGAVLVDESLVQLPAFSLFLEALERQAKSHFVWPHASSVGGLADGRSLGSALDGSDFFVAYGGGTTMDRAKLGRLYQTGWDPDRDIPDASRGWWRLVDDGAQPLPFLAVPTTLGTGSERNGNAIVQVGGYRNLISGSALIPTATLLGVANYTTLPRRVVLDGVFEALARVCEAYTFPGAEVADQLAVSVAAELARLGDTIAPMESVPAGTLKQVAKLSSMTHSQSLNRGRPPFAFRSWCISHELSTALGFSKVGSLARVLRQLHSLTDAENHSFGDPKRRRTILAAVGAARGVKVDASKVFSQLITDWQILVAPRPGDPHELACRILRRWGGDHISAHLHGVATGEVEQILGGGGAE